MPTQPQIRRKIPFVYPHQHPPPRRGTQHPMLWEMHPAKEVNTGGKGFDEYFVGVKFKVKCLGEKGTDVRNE